jgi:hypothetical protein
MGWGAFAAGAAAVGLPIFFLMYYVANGGEHRNARWETFKIAHHCRLIEAWSGDAGTDMRFASDTAYLCDDGVKYRR